MYKAEGVTSDFTEFHYLYRLGPRRKKRKEKTTPFGVNLMRSPVLYRAAQVWPKDTTGRNQYLSLLF